MQNFLMKGSSETHAERTQNFHLSALQKRTHAERGITIHINGMSGNGIRGNEDEAVLVII
jgi:hypothetical protein